MLPFSSLILDALDLLLPALSGSLITFLAFWLYLRKQRLQERELYLGAVDKLVASLWQEIDRLNTDRRAAAARIRALEHSLQAHPPSPMLSRAPDRPPTKNPPA